MEMCHGVMIAGSTSMTYSKGMTYGTTASPSNRVRRHLSSRITSSTMPVRWYTWLSSSTVSRWIVSPMDMYSQVVFLRVAANGSSMTVSNSLARMPK